MMTTANPDLIFALAFLAITLVLFLLGRLLVGSKRNQGQENAPQPLVFGGLTQLLAAILPVYFEGREALEQDLKRAGYYHRQARQEYLAIRNVLVVGWVVLTGAVTVVAVQPGRDYTMPILLVGGMVAIVLFSVPRLMLQAQASERLKRIQKSLPDAIDMLTMTMMGGLPLQQALAHVNREIGATYPDVACELSIVRRHMETGSLDQALRQFANRIDLPDIQSLTALVSQTERLGSNIAQAFRDFSDGVRRSQRQRAEARSNSISVAMILPIVLCLAPPIYILLLGPALLELRNFVQKGTSEGGVLRPDTSGLTPTILGQNNANSAGNARQ